MSAVDHRASVPAHDMSRPPDDINADLGFGAIVARESRKRLLNRDGTFNVRREGLRFWESLSAYHYLLTISWSRFFSFIVAAYLAANAIFALLYVSLGDGALNGVHGTTFGARFLEAFFFSVHTLATIGYGSITPHSLVANLMVTVETLIGLVGVAVMAGISFSRFSRPVATVVFSRNAIIAPYRGGRAFMFRIVNRRSNQLVNLETKVLLTRRKRDGVSNADREFLNLTLERESVVFFPLAWTIVHPIDEKSPINDWTGEDIIECDAEFLVLLNGFDETFSQTVHTRSSYKAAEIVWGAKFKSMFNPPREDGLVTVDIRRIHDYDRVQL
jgi:inward rectifier potassium channel